MSMIRSTSTGWKVFLMAAGASILLYLSIVAHLISPDVRAAVASYYEGTIVHRPPLMFFLEVAFFFLNYPALQAANAASLQDLLRSVSPVGRFVLEYTIAVVFSLVWWGLIALLMDRVVRHVTDKRAHRSG